jgi:hypothetical protein
MTDSPGTNPASTINIEFLPDWAREPQDRGPRNYADHNKTTDNESTRLKGGGSGHRRAGRPGGPPANRGNRGERRDGHGRDRMQRGGRPTHRGMPRHNESPQQIKPDPALEAIEIAFLGEATSIEAVVQQVKSSTRAYPLFSLARMFLEKPDRHLVRARRKGPGKGQEGQGGSLYQSELSKQVFLNEADAVRHTLKKFKDRFYKEQKIQTEAPKGNFTSVARCKLDGTFLGPTNHHAYQSNLLQLYKTKFSHLPFEKFKSSIASIHDPEAVKQWQEQSTWKILYLPLDSDTPVGNSQKELSGASSQAESPTHSQVSGGVETPPAPAVSDAQETTDQEPSQVQGPGAQASPTLLTYAEMEKHFRQHHMATSISSAREALLPGPVSRNLEESSLGRHIRNQWESEDKFPIHLANRLKEHFFKAGLMVFKGRKGMQYVTHIRPKPLTADPVDLSPGIRKILEYLEKHHGGSRAKILEALSGAAPVNSPIAASVDVKSQDSIPVQASDEPTTGSGNSGGSPESTHAAPPTPQQAEVLQDLHYLIHQGHIIEYHNGILEVARPPKRNIPKASAKPPQKDAAGAEVKPGESQNLEQLPESQPEQGEENIDQQADPLSEGNPQPAA